MKDLLITWECNNCESNPCELKVRDSDGQPTFCPFGITRVSCNFQQTNSEDDGE